MEYRRRRNLYDLSLPFFFYKHLGEWVSISQAGIMEKKQLPEDLIVQILLRLPVKSLLRFRSVSKSWFSLISNPQFAKLHFELAAAPTHKLMYLAAFNFETRSIDLEASLHDDSASVEFKLNFLPPPSIQTAQIMGSCRGFLLFDFCQNLLLWNPSIGVHKQLPSSPVASNMDSFTFLYGFGYDALEDDYMVVLASYEPNVTNSETYFEIFSLRADSWGKIENTHLPYMNAGDDVRAGCLLNGAIHWLAFRYDATNANVIIAFDLKERIFSEIPLPDDDDQEFEGDYEYTDLRVLGGCLSLCYVGYDTAEIWVMKEYNVKSSWAKSIVVSLKEIPTQYFSPICFTKHGNIVGIDGSTGLVKCNAKGEVLEHRTYCEDPHGCEVVVYTESLLSLPPLDDSRQVGEDDQE